MSARGARPAGRLALTDPAPVVAGRLTVEPRAGDQAEGLALAASNTASWSSASPVWTSAATSRPNASGSWSPAMAAVVSRGGRPDLAGPALERVLAPTLLIVGGADTNVLALNRQAAARLAAEHRLEVVPGASHLFEERARWMRSPTWPPPGSPPTSAGGLPIPPWADGRRRRHRDDSRERAWLWRGSS
jgi:alpha-beta hydrolase superfamily lysophospholipase